MKRAILITPEGECKKVEVGEPELRSLQGFVGGYIEDVPLAFPEEMTAFCNEEGKILGLPWNLVATKTLGMRGDVLAGTVIVLGPTGADGETRGLTEEEQSLLLRGCTIMGGTAA